MTRRRASLISSPHLEVKATASQNLSQIVTRDRWGTLKWAGLAMELAKELAPWLLEGFQVPRTLEQINYRSKAQLSRSREQTQMDSSRLAIACQVRSSRVLARRFTPDVSTWEMYSPT